MKKKKIYVIKDEEGIPIGYFGTRSWAEVMLNIIQKKVDRLNAYVEKKNKQGKLELSKPNSFKGEIAEIDVCQMGDTSVLKQFPSVSEFKKLLYGKA